MKLDWITSGRGTIRIYKGDFQSTDPLLSSGNPANPQSWNRYAYVWNNPLRLIDPDGLEVYDNGFDEEIAQVEDEGLEMEVEAQRQRTVPVTIKRVDKTYPVQGNTAQEAADDAKKKALAQGIGGGSIGQTRFDPVYNPTTSNTFEGNTATFVVSGITLDASITVITPSWEGYSSAPAEEKAKWDSFINRLKDNEEGHVQIYTEGAKAEAAALEPFVNKTFTFTGKTGSQASANALAYVDNRVRVAFGLARLNIAGRNHNYDQLTDHGKCQIEHSILNDHAESENSGLVSL